MEQTRGLFCTCHSGVACCQSFVLHVPLGCGSLSITTPVLLEANEFEVASLFHRQVSLAAVSQICIIHEAMNGYKNLKIHLMRASKM